MKAVPEFWRKHSVFLRYFGGLLILSCALIFLIAGMLFFTSQSALRRQLAQVETTYLGSVGESFSSYLLSARQTANALTASDQVKQVIISGDSEWSELMHNCFQLVRQGISSNACFASIALIGGDEILLKSERNYQSNAYDRQMVDMMIHRSNETICPWRMASTRKEHQYVSIIQPMDALQPPNHVGGVLVTLDIQKVAKLVFSGSIGQFYALDKQGRVIVSSEESAFLLTPDELPQLREAMDGNGEAWIDDARYVVSSAAFDAFTLYHFTPYQQFYGSIRQYALGALLILLVCVALSIPLSLLLARRAYQPVKNVFIQLVSGMENEAPQSQSPVNDLQEVSNAIVHIYETIDAYRKDIDASALRACLTNGIVKEKDVEMLRHSLANLPHHRLVVIGPAEDADGVQRATDIASSYISGSYHVTSISTGEGTITLVVSDRTPIEEERLRMMLDGVSASLRQLLPQTVLFAISPAVIDVAGLHEAYQSAMKRMSLSALYARSGCIHALEERPVDSALQDAVCGYALRQQHDAFLQAFESLCETYQPLAAETAFEQLALLSVRLQQPHKALTLRAADSLPLFSEEYRRLRALRTHSALCSHFLNLFIAAAAQNDNAQDGEGKRLAELSMAYIQQHFSECALSAQEAADTLGVSVSHFSRVLKKHTGKTFLELVTSFRMEKAEQLLADSPGMPITALSHACGFSSPSYFTASFKKWFGVTPSEYRARLTTDGLGAQTREEHASHQEGTL